MHVHKHRKVARRGAAVLELAVLLPLLVYLFVIGVDFARCYYHQVTLNNAARNGAVYGARDVKYSTDTNGIRDAALADASNLSPAPTVSSTTGTDSLGHPCVNVTVSWQFKTISNFPGVPSNMTLTRTVQMRVAPSIPKGS